MKLFAFVDIHGDEGLLAQTIEKARKADIVVCAGDITIFENRIEKILKQLNSLNKPIFILHGNHETAAALSLALHDFPNITFLHKKYFVFDDFIIFGWGGGGFSINEPNFDKAASDFLDQWKALEKKNNKKYKLILITHAPPYGTKLDDLGEHVGCKNIANFIKRFQPIYAISGHIHETFGQKDKIDNSVLINPGPEGMMFDL